jgi:hypothetical protein
VGTFIPDDVKNPVSEKLRFRKTSTTGNFLTVKFIAKHRRQKYLEKAVSIFVNISPMKDIISAFENTAFSANLLSQI